MARLEGANAEYFSKFKQHGFEVTVLDDEVIKKIAEISNKLADEQADKDPLYARALESQRKFKVEYGTWKQWGCRKEVISYSS